MKLGAMIFATDQNIAIPKLAVALEERGFESLWIPEKTHLPASSAAGASPYTAHGQRDAGERNS